MTRLAALATLTLLSTVSAQSADELFARLTDEQKAGQLLMQWTLSRMEPDNLEKLDGWVEDVGLGGMILSLGTVADAAALVTFLQEDAKIPLLIAADFEGSVAFRLEGATELGCNMLVGATRSARLARAAGRVVGTEARALGVHWCFSPVLDVNVNALNPIINVRSYGEEPQLVAKLGVAFTEGVQSAGVIATAKHFPGHGDVASDSHLVMPTVPGDRARLDQVELVPFRAAIDAGVRGVMTGHLSVPGLGEADAVPATLSTRILTKLLREEFGFDGLIVTDALDMGGVRQTITPEQAAVRALIAGADTLLMPPDPASARDAVLAALRNDVVPRERFDAAVMRVLGAKERAGLLDGRGQVDPRWRTRVDTKAHRDVAREIARRGVTLVKDDRGLLPVQGERPVAITLMDDPTPRVGRRFDGMLALVGDGWQNHFIGPGAGRAAVEAAVEAAQNADPLVVALHIKVASFADGKRVPFELRPIIEAMRQSERCIAVSFGNPYLIQDFPEVSTYVDAYCGTVWAEVAAAESVLGRQAFTGRSPVSIPGVCEVRDGLTLLPPGELGRSSPEAEDLAADLPASITALLERSIEAGAFPGAVAMVSRRGNLVAEVAAGRYRYEPDSPEMTTDALFDLASLTKVCATTPAALTLIDAGELELDTPVGRLVPAFRGEGKDAITVHHLLTHTAGLPPFVRFFAELEGKAAIVEAAAKTPLATEPDAYRYSDIGMILLMACIERITGEPFDRVVRERVFRPLGMRRARFTASGTPITAVPTEDCAWRGRVVRGQVHDENAFAMGGVSGHAGMFATAEDVTKLGVAFLGGGRRWLSAPLARRAIAKQSGVSSRALGWDTFVAGRSGGSKLSVHAFGHTGFTGTSIWCDPATDLTIVLLTNRVHPSRDNRQVSRVRRELADLVAGSVR